MQIEWERKYEIGCHDFDEQHKWLITLYNRIYSSLEHKSPTSVIGKYISSLNHYTVFHFGAEESALLKYGYPELESHKKQHKAFIEKINSLTHSYTQGNENAAHELLRYLKGWLLDHIMDEDRQYVSYIGPEMFKLHA